MPARAEITGRKPGHAQKSEATPCQARASPEPMLKLVQRQAFSIDEFCRRHGISKAHYYNLKKVGLAPREMEVRGRKLISIEAEVDWRREREGISTG